MSVPSLRLDQRASEAYPAVNSNFVNGNTFSHVFEYSGKTAAEIRTYWIGFSDNNPLNLVVLYQRQQYKQRMEREFQQRKREQQQ